MLTLVLGVQHNDSTTLYGRLSSPELYFCFQYSDDLCIEHKIKGSCEGF